MAENEKRSKPVTSASMDQESIDFVKNLAVEKGLTYSSALEHCVNLTKAAMSEDTYDVSPDHYKLITLTSNIGRSGLFAKDQTIILAELLLEIREMKAIMSKLLNKVE